MRSTQTVIGERGDRAKVLHGAAIENRQRANEWRRAGVGLATRQRRSWGPTAPGERGRRSEAGPGVGPAVWARARRGRRAAGKSWGQHGPREPGRGAAVVPSPAPRPSPPGPPRSSTAAGKASRKSSSRRGRSLMVRPVSVQYASARALGGSGGNGVTLHPGRAGGAGHARAPPVAPPRYRRRGL